MSGFLPRLFQIVCLGFFLMKMADPFLPVQARMYLHQEPESATQVQVSPFETQSPLVRELKGGEKHGYHLKLQANDFLRLVVEQQGIDVVVRLLGPDGKLIQEVDSPNGTQGPEPVSSIVEVAGTYTLEIEALEKTALPGKYEVKSEAIKPATEQDRAQVAITRLYEQSRQLRQAGKYAEALPLAEQALKRWEKLLGPESPLVADSLNNLAEIYRAIGKYDLAEPLLVRSLAIYEKAFGADHPLVAESLNNLGVIAFSKGDYLRAEPFFERVLAMREKILGPDHPDFAQSLNNLAFLTYTKGDYARAETLYVRAIAIREKVLGGIHPDVAESINNLAMVYQDQGDFARAEAFYLKALGIWEKSLGEEHLNVIYSVTGLAVLYYNQGNYLRAEPLYIRALGILEKTFGKDHPAIATNLSSLALLYFYRGEYARAEPLYIRALAIQEKLLGENHPDIALSLNNLALLYKNKGDYLRAEPLYVRAVAIKEKALGATHPDIAPYLINLADLYHRKGNSDQAERFYQRALAISEQALGPGSLSVTPSLNGLAVIYDSRGDHSRAEPLFVRALAILDKVLGKDHPSIAVTLNNLAALYRAQGEYVRAEPLYTRSVAILEKAFGADHPDIARSLNNLAGLYQAKGDVVQAVSRQVHSNEVSERDLVRNLVTGSERQKLLYLNQTARNTEKTISLNIQAAPKDPIARQAALTVILRRKGRALDALTTSIETLRRQQTPKTQKLLDEYTALAGQISVLTLRGPGSQKPEVHLALLHSLEEQKEKLENEISRESKEFNAQTLPITLKGVQEQIPTEAVLLEFAVYRPYDAKKDQFGTPRYVVYSLDYQGNIAVADLGDTEPIDQCVIKLRQVLSHPKTKIESEVKPVAQALGRLVLSPIRGLIGKATRLLISPDGRLSLIPFAALMDEKGKFLLENYQLTYLTSGRDLLRLAVKVESRTPTFLIADPDYATGTGPILAGKQFSPLIRLTGTKVEGLSLKTLFPDAELKMQAEATEQAIKNVRRPELLHIATHGRFLEDIPGSSLQAESRTVGASELPGIDTEKLRIENPLLRSWLFFAGANRGGNDETDGTLTALEAAQLDLWGTKLVVLSACETGVGEAKIGDGVYGLRRALVLAGSEAQLMSLWAVSDRGTQELMIEYYTRLKAGEGRSEALRNTQLKMLNDLRRRHPFYWASFIQSGEWRPIISQP